VFIAGDCLLRSPVFLCVNVKKYFVSISIQERLDRNNNRIYNNLSGNCGKKAGSFQKYK
jgi:hypothetical protein